MILSPEQQKGIDQDRLSPWAIDGETGATRLAASIGKHLDTPAVFDEHRATIHQGVLMLRQFVDLAARDMEKG